MFSFNKNKQIKARREMKQADSHKMVYTKYTLCDQKKQRYFKSLYRHRCKITEHKNVIIVIRDAKYFCLDIDLIFR